MDNVKKMKYTVNKNNLPVAFKNCPKCGGTGQVPCTGKEYYHEVARRWALSMHGRFVSIPFYTENRTWSRISGLAIMTKVSGGWHGVKVYVTLDKGPNWGGFGLHHYQGADEDHDVINERRIYFISKGHTAAKDVLPVTLDEVPEVLGAIRLLTGAGRAESEGSQ